MKTCPSPSQILGDVIALLAGETVHFRHTTELLLKLQKMYGLQPQFIMEHVERAGFFKAEGLVKVATVVGLPPKEVKELAKRLKEKDARR